MKDIIQTGEEYKNYLTKNHDVLTSSRRKYSHLPHSDSGRKNSYCVNLKQYIKTKPITRSLHSLN